MNRDGDPVAPFTIRNIRRIDRANQFRKSTTVAVIIRPGYSGGGKAFGIIVYTIKEGGKTLSGNWLFYPGGTDLGIETLIRK